MKEIASMFLCLLFLFLPCSLYAQDNTSQYPKDHQWKEYSVDSISVSYIDIASIQRTYENYGKDLGGGKAVLRASAWFLTNHPSWPPDGNSIILNNGEKIPNPGATKFSSVLIHVEFDCQHKLSHLLSITEYRGYMGHGKIVDSSSSDTKWVNDFDTNSNQQIEDLACNGFPYGYVKPEKQHVRKEEVKKQTDVAIHNQGRSSFPTMTPDGISIEDKAVLIDTKPDTLKLIDQSVNIIRENGYQCTSISGFHPFITSRGFELTCNNFSYEYDFEDKGRGFEFVQPK